MFTLLLIILWLFVGFFACIHLFRTNEIDELSDFTFCYFIFICGPLIWVLFLWSMLIVLNQDKKNKC